MWTWISATCRSNPKRQDALARQYHTVHLDLDTAPAAVPGAILSWIDLHAPAPSAVSRSNPRGAGGALSRLFRLSAASRSVITPPVHAACSRIS